MLRLTLSLMLLATPSLAIAAECHSKTCAEGQVWDEETKACIKPSA